MFSALIIYFQLILGKILNKISFSELKSGRKYLVLIENLLLILISLILLKLDLKLILALIFGFFIFNYFKNLYFLLGLSVVLNLGFSLYLVLILTLIHSSLNPFKFRSFLLDSLFFILPFSLFFIETFINANLSIFIGLLIGGLIAQIGPVAQLGRATVKRKL